MSKSPAESLYEEVNVNGRIEHVDQMIVFVKTKQGNFITMKSSNCSQNTTDAAIRMLEEEG